ncbi:helicase, partial [gut metagenome]
PENHIVIDFDILDLMEKSFERNLEAASKWPRTYAELSKSGAGIHLHYIYTGDATRLSRIYDENIEVKVYTGKSSLRRKLSKCNDISVATISSGLPLKGETKMVNASVA